MQSHASFDLADPAGCIGNQAALDYIRAHPGVRALSSHQMSYPLFCPPNMRIYPVFFLRHPLDRAMSALRFLYAQLEKLGDPRYADYRDFGDFARQRIDASFQPNLQVSILSRSTVERMGAGKVPWATRARIAERNVAGSPFFGIVERFAESLDLLRISLDREFPGIDYAFEALNVSRVEDGYDARLANFSELVGAERMEKLLGENAWDAQLYEFGLREFERRRARARRRFKWLQRTLRARQVVLAMPFLGASLRALKRAFKGG